VVGKKSPNFPRNLRSDFGQYTGERPADFAKATTAKEVTEGQNKKRNITMKASKRSNDKKVKLDLKALTLNKAQWYLLGVFVWLPWLPGTEVNHNEMFLADVS